ncbi:MAG: DsrE/DsrF-like family [Armatimonadota bacterium]|jgi:predicted peroxiredoxin
MDASPTPQEPDLQIIISSGTGNVHQVVLGFSAALAAAQMGTNVTIVFSMLGAHWASDSVGHDNPVPGFPSIAELKSLLVESGVTLEACSTCIENYCPVPLGQDGKRILPPDITRVGLGLIASRMATVNTVVF